MTAMNNNPSIVNHSVKHLLLCSTEESFFGLDQHEGGNDDRMCTLFV